MHRDIKPQNVLLDDKGFGYLSDFGLAKHINKKEKLSGLAGTMCYVAPEVINQEDYDYTADWWSLGCILFEMLTGTSPFYDDSKKVEDI